MPARGATIHSFGGFLPDNRISAASIEDTLRSLNPWLHIADGFFELMTGIQSKPQAESGLQSSDLAVFAAQKTMAQAQLSTRDIDLLIFAAASQDIIEPATANIVQYKLGLHCPVFDVKNACNSFMNGLEIATAMIGSGLYKNVLVVTGEMPSRVVDYQFQNKSDFKQGFASLTLGDGGGAAMVSASKTTNVGFMKMASYGSNWQLATFLGGGSMYPKDASMMRFQGNGGKLKQAFLDLGDNTIDEALKACNMNFSDIKQIFLHQVAAGFTTETLEMIGAPTDKAYRTVERQGNLASASLPIAISQAQSQGAIAKGDTILLIGLASGISVGIMLLTI